MRINKSKVQRRKKAYKKKLNVKTIKSVVKQVLQKEIETKTINVPDPVGVTSNTVNRLYLQGSGLQYLALDIFKVSQGVQDSTLIGGVNRIGDRVRGVGILMDYFFHTRSNFSVGAFTYHIPFVKLRVTVFQQAYSVSLPTITTLYDANFLAGAGATLRPIDYDEGTVRNTLYDKVFIIRNPAADPLSTNPNAVVPVSNVMQFKKYIKYDKFIKYMDSNTLNPDGTANPIYLTINAEVDDSLSGLVPSGTTLLYMTGRTQAWFKDA